MDTTKPRVGVGVIILNDAGKILILRRIGPHAPKYSIPGGKLESGETLEACAIREIKEECNIKIFDPEVIAVTNNLETFREEGVHFISIILLVRKYEGEPLIMEPSKHSELLWVDPNLLPEPHFDASRSGVQCYLEKKFYIPGQG